MVANQIIFTVEDSLYIEFTARVLRHSIFRGVIFTEVNTIEELNTNIKDTLKCHFHSDVSLTTVYRDY